MVRAQLSQPLKNHPDNSVAAIAHERERVFCLRSDALKNPAPRHGAAAMQADFHIVLGEIERGGGFCRTQSFDVAQHDHGAVLLRKTEHGLFQKLTEFRTDALCSGSGEVSTTFI